MLMRLMPLPMSEELMRTSRWPAATGTRFTACPEKATCTHTYYGKRRMYTMQGQRRECLCPMYTNMGNLF